MKTCDRCECGFDDDYGLDWKVTTSLGERKATLCDSCCRVLLEDLMLSPLVFQGVTTRISLYPHKKEKQS